MSGNLRLVIPISSLPVWSDDFFCVLFHPMSGATYMLSQWALIVMNLIADGQNTRDVLINSLRELASESAIDVPPVFLSS